MASQWALVDDQFPHFQGDESVPEQIRALVNYMFVLAEQLRYMLSNLKAENWNQASLAAFSQETTDAAAKTVEQQLQDVSQTVDALNQRLKLLAGIHEQDVTQLQERDAYFERTAQDQAGQILQLQEGVSQAEHETGQLQEQVTGEGGLEQRLAEVAGQLQILNQILMLQKAEDPENGRDSVFLGAEGADIRLVGKGLWFNGELIGGTADETA